ncbi:MAG: sugar MFS transporter [Pseudomonadota bacterium]
MAHAQCTNPVKANASGSSYAFPLVVLTSLFFMWGFLTCLNDILIPHLKALFSLNYTEVMLIQFCFFTAYFLVSIPAGALVEKIGYKKGVVVGLSTAGLGCLLFYPAAGTHSYPIFLVALFILASGITLLQVAANPYVAILGKSETSSSRLTLTQAFNSLGTTVAPYFGSLLILYEGLKTAEASASAVQRPYLGLAVALFVMAAIFALIKLPEIEAPSTKENEDDSHPGEAKSAWAYPHLVLGAIAIFVYVGAEVSIGSFLVNFIHEPRIGNLSVAEAGKFISFYWGGAMVGRFIGSAVMRKINPGKLLAFNACMASLLAIVTMSISGHAAMWTILAVGLFNSIMFPTIFALAVAKLGKHTGQGSGILCMAIVGGAILPVISGFIADSWGIQHAFVLPAICYLYIAYYGLKGHMKRKLHGVSSPVVNLNKTEEAGAVS